MICMVKVAHFASLVQERSVLIRTCMAVLAALFLPVAAAEEVILKDGRILTGKLGLVTGLVDIPKLVDPEGAGPIPLIVFVDDDLRRTFVSKRQIREIRPGITAEIQERFRFRQPVAEQGASISSVGFPVRVTPFDEFGRRIYTMLTTRGKVDVIQGITEITPQWVRIQGITHVWDMRLATTSLPKDVLYRILVKASGDSTSVDTRKRIARFFVQMGRYEDAVQELQNLLNDPQLPANEKPDIEQSLRSLKQLSARKILEELRLRSKAGQHRTVYTLLEKFPTEGVAGEILQEVREFRENYEKQAQQAKDLLSKLEALIQGIDQTAVRQLCLEIFQEIAAQLSPDTLPRLAAFSQLVDDNSVPGEDRVALAISGWLVGADRATRNLSVALSMYRTRALIVEYLNENDTMKKGEILERLRKEEGSLPVYSAGILASMAPPRPLPAEVPGKSGFFEVEINWDAKEPPARYLVQLPPEYHPLRRYPAIVTLHGLQTTAEQQIDWWAGPFDENGYRHGQAGRHGYIVIAPQWTQERQVAYQYSAREHGLILAVLRDALSRFSIDTDRVFLSGHFAGGDAAWDIGLAHPSLWAGVIVIAGRSDKYCTFYWENAAQLPFYVVLGELDGTLMADNARDLDRCLNRGFNTTVVEYQGRGRDSFSDEILRIFEWMSYQQRDPAPRDFTARTMRLFDNFFWYVELQEMPPAVVEPPLSWPPANPTPLIVRGRIPSENTVMLQVGAAKATVGLNPEIIDFDKRSTILVNTRRLDTRDLAPDVETLLNDVARRWDRQHPFWVTIETSTGRVIRPRR